jgi:hypothetical protein
MTLQDEEALVRSHILNQRTQVAEEIEDEEILFTIALFVCQVPSGTTGAMDDALIEELMLTRLIEPA